MIQSLSIYWTYNQDLPITLIMLVDTKSFISNHTLSIVIDLPPLKCNRQLTELRQFSETVCHLKDYANKLQLLNLPVTRFHSYHLQAVVSRSKKKFYCELVPDVLLLKTHATPWKHFKDTGQGTRLSTKTNVVEGTSWWYRIPRKAMINERISLLTFLWELTQPK